MRSSILIAAVLMSIAAAGADYFPLKEGNRWKYQLSNGLEMTARIAGFERVGDIRCARVENTVGEQTTVELLAAGPDGVKAYKYKAGPQEMVYDPPALRIKLPFKAGDSWNWKFTQGGITTSSVSRYVGKENVETPAGTYEAIRIEVTLSSSGGSIVATNWFADGVGLVRQTLRSPAGEMTSELTETNVVPGASRENALPEHAAPVVHEGGEPPPMPGEEATAPPAPAAEGAAADRVCPKCGAKVSAKAKFCEECGTKIPPPSAARPTACPKCGAALGPTARFCPDCGMKIEGAAPARPGAAEAAAKAAKAAPPPRGTGPELTKCRSTDGRTMFFSPKGWKVEDGPFLDEVGYKITMIEPEENAAVFFVTFPVNDEIKDSVALAAKVLKGIGEELDALEVKRMASDPDKARTIADLTFSTEGKKGIGHAYFFLTEKVGTMFLLLAREDRWEGLRPTLLTVAANIAYAPGGVERTLEEGRQMVERSPVAAAGKSPAAIIREAGQKQGKKLPLQPAALADGSMAMQIPQGWTLEGQRLQVVLIDDPRARTRGMSFVSHTVIPMEMPMPGVLTCSYQPPQQALALLIEMGRVGTGMEVLGECPSELAFPEMAAGIRTQRAQGIQEDARILHVKFTSKATGEPLRGMFNVDCSIRPMSPVWSCLVNGCWAPEAEFADYYPMFLRLAKSMRPNEAWVGQELTRGAARQQQLNRNLQNSIAEANNAFDGYLDSLQNASRSRDYLGWRQSQTTLGLGTWVAENEGAKVYQTDSWGIVGPEGRADHPEYNTANFTGESPWGGRLEQVDTRADYERYVRGQ